MIKELRIAWEAFKKEYRKTHPKVIAHCKWCGNPIFHYEGLDKSEFEKTGECVFCYEAYKCGVLDCKMGTERKRVLL